MSDNPPAKPPGRPDPGTVTQSGVLIVSGVLIFVVIVLSMILGLTSHRATVGLVVFVIFLAAAAVGTFAGFIFGLPRGRFADRNEAGDAPNSAAPGASAFLANSNLIKVSDWLTTIIVGLTLVNLGAILPAMQRFASALQEPLGGAAYSGAVGLSVTTLGFISAALMSYLWTTMRGRDLWEETEAKYRGRQAPDLKGLTVAEAKAVVAPLALFVDAESADANGDVKRQTPEPGAATPDGRIRVFTA